jgi:hypothetical protein
MTGSQQPRDGQSKDLVGARISGGPVPRQVGRAGAGLVGQVRAVGGWGRVCVRNNLN